MTDNPYVGPRPFRRAEEARFFGRQTESDQVAGEWLAERVTVLQGPSAVGKSSLLNAGVLPRLPREPQIKVLPVGRVARQSAQPLAMATPYNAYRYALLSTWSGPDQVPDPGTELLDFLRPHAEGASNLLIAIDQFEELFTSVPGKNEDRLELLRGLGAVLRELPVNLLIVIRDECLGQLSVVEAELPYAPVQLRLEGLTRPDAVEAVTGPLRGTPRGFAPGAAEGLVDALRTVTYTDRLGRTETIVSDRVEPLSLQIQCHRLWAALDDDLQVITAAHWAPGGDAAHVMADFYLEAVRAAADETGQREQAVRSWLAETFITEHGTRGTAYRGITMTADMPNALADALVVRHVLTTEARANAVWYQLSQDRLIAVARQAVTVRRAEPGPGLPADYRAAAETALGVGDFGSARRFAEVAADGYQQAGDDLRRAHAMALHGNIAKAEGDLPAAVRSFDAACSEFEIIDDQRSAARMRGELGRIYLAMSDFAAAEELLRLATSQLPEDAELRVELGRALWRLGRLVRAEAVLNQALDLSPALASGYVERGLVRRALREVGGAVADLRQALALGGLTPGDEARARSALRELEQG
ncbi:tetratricopeptide repeat protein [Nonomuraea sp. NPDC050790]|uniref:nSTAND1 domain-containing NTPase n=1 Tax=Nonomuraea sp. NPDC050790 TaxID=3364371 RepID=UPI0037A52A09